MRQVVSIIALVLASSAGVSAQEEQRANRSHEGEHPCSRFKMRVVSPPEDVDFKLRLVAPPSDVEYKGKVFNPCPKEELNVAALPRVLPHAIRQVPRPSGRDAFVKPPRPSDGEAFVKPPSFSYQLMPDSTGAAPGATRRYEPRLKQFMNDK